MTHGLWQCLAVLDHLRRRAVEDSGEQLAVHRQPVQRGVDDDQRRRPDRAPGHTEVVADDGVLYDVGQQEHDRNVEGVQPCQPALTGEPDQPRDERVDEDGSQQLLGNRDLLDEHLVPHGDSDRSRCHSVSTKSPASRRSRRRTSNSRCRSSRLSAVVANRELLNSTVASSAILRPSSVITASVPRPSRGLGSRRTRPAAASRSITFVTEVACTCNRSPILESGSAPSCEWTSSTSASYRLNVIPYGRSIASSSAMRIWWARMIDVTARIDAYTSGSSFGEWWAQSSPARSIGSNSSGDGMTRA